MAEYKVFKETALPGQLSPNSLYLVAPPGSQYMEVYATTSDGSGYRRTMRESDVQALITAIPGGGGASNPAIVALNIAERDALTPTHGMIVLVANATGDSTVTSGGATYVYDADLAQGWVKISETESLDLVLSWARISGKPSSTPANIDDAVNKRHVHSNMTQLNLIGQDGDGRLTYNGELPVTGWSTTNW